MTTDPWTKPLRRFLVVLGVLYFAGVGFVLHLSESNAETKHLPSLRVAVDPGCEEDQAAVVAPSPTEGLAWRCVTLDDWATPVALERLHIILHNSPTEGEVP